MSNFKLFAGKIADPKSMRVIYVLLALLAMALAGGAPDGFGPGF